jgi:epoxyqueuosine reductase
MKTAIHQRALELGFDDCRFTTALPPDHARAFQDWLHTGQHGEMSWLARNAEKRLAPRTVLPGAKTIITLATSYHTPTAPGPRPSRAQQHETGQDQGNVSPVIDTPEVLRPGTGALPEQSAVAPAAGVIARYARYADYHDVLGRALKTLTEHIIQLGGPATATLWYVDTGPLLERDLAQRAGLGFTGKHTNLISRRLGNWLFLSEIITTLELEPDPPAKNYCGTCTRCLAACPTNAITAPFQLDARRCISYLTIELKGPIPVELRPAIGHRIFGCDDCLAVCPWNRFARAGSLMQPHARPDLQAPDLIELLRLDDAGFKARFAGTPLLRTKRRGLLRNVCVALGNTADATALPHLEKAARDPDPLIAEHARWAIEQIESRPRPMPAPGAPVSDRLNFSDNGGALLPPEH